MPRFATVLDRSGSMTGAQLEQAKLGARVLLDLARDGEELAQVSFASAATVDQPRHPLGPDREAEAFAIESLTAQGETSIGDGLRTGLEQLGSAPVRSSVPVIVLITDGRQTHGEDPSTVLPDLVRTLTRVFVAGVGPDLDETLLQDVAARTGGLFVRIDPDQPADAQALALRSAMERFASLARAGDVVTDGSPEQLADGERVERTRVVEPGAGTVTFVVSWPRNTDRVELELFDPSGQPVPTDGSGPGVRVVRSDRPYLAVEVDQPAAGRWRMRLTGRTRQGPVAVQRWTFVDNPDLVGAVHLPPGPVAPGTRVRAGFGLAYRPRLTGLRITGRLVEPDGVRRIRFRPGRAATGSEGEYTASFRAPEQAGTYPLELTVRHHPRRTRNAAIAGADEPVPTPPVPSFTRRYTALLVVG